MGSSERESNDKVMDLIEATKPENREQLRDFLRAAIDEEERTDGR